MSKVNIALLHYPVYNKNKQVVTTNITGFDLHDIARTCATFGVKRYYVVNPTRPQQEFASRIINCWMTEASYAHNWTRAEAFKLIRLKSTLDEVVKELKNPVIVATSARSKGGTSYKTLKDKIKRSRKPFLILFGTGWGMTEEVLDQAEYLLEPINGSAAYNHLSVRSAAAIILDRLLS